MIRKSKKKEYLVVGAGLSGAVIAGVLARRGHKITIIERRGHVGGNLFDERDENGFTVQRYGPHIFHTNNERVYRFIKEYGAWDEFSLECMAHMKGKYTPSPFNFQTVDDYFDTEKAKAIKASIAARFGERKKASVLEMLESDDKTVKEYARFLFENDYRPYTAKQWGIPPEKIDASVLRRVPVLFSYERGYFDDRYQCMPKEGFTRFIEKIIRHKNIKLKLNTDASSIISIADGKLLINGRESDKTVVYTGALDELLCGKYGALPYRSLRFEYRTENVDSFQPAPVVQYPEAPLYTRITEYSKLPPQKTHGRTLIAVEYPIKHESGVTEPYYPIPTSESLSLYKKYRESVEGIPNLVVCGRLGDFKYYNMDAAILRALEICDTI